MSARFRFYHESYETETKYMVELQDSEYTGSVVDLKNNGFTFEHLRLSDTQPFLQNIYEGKLALNVIIGDNSSSDFLRELRLNEIVGSEEDRYKLVLKIERSGLYETLWTGSLLPDLSVFDNSFYPYTATLVAKDFVVSKATSFNFSLQQNERRRLIDIIKDILHNELNINIKALTNYSAIASNDDFLSYVYLDDNSIRDYEGVVPMTAFLALEWLTQSNNLILKQWDNTWYIHQVSSYGEQTGFVYNSNSDSTSTEVIKRSLPSPTIESAYSIAPGLSLVKGVYKHRTRISKVNPPVQTYFTVATNLINGKKSTGFFDSDSDSHVINTAGFVECAFQPGQDSMQFSIEIAYGDLRWIESGVKDNGDIIEKEWVNVSELGGPSSVSLASYRNVFNMEQVQEGFYSSWKGSFSIETDYMPSGNREEFFISYFPCDSDGVLNTAIYSSVSFEINDDDPNKNNEYIEFIRSNDSKFTSEYTTKDIYFGDEVVEYQISKYLLQPTAGNFTTTSLWGFKGETREYEFVELIAEDILSFMSVSKRIFQAVVKYKTMLIEPFNPNFSYEYNGKVYAYFGGQLDGLTGAWSVNFLEVGSSPSNGSTELNIVPPEGDNFTLVRKTSGLTPIGNIGNSVIVEKGGQTGTLSSQIKNLTPEGELPEKSIDKSDQRLVTMDAGVTNLVLDISGDTTVVRVNLNQEATINFLGFKLENENYTGSQLLRDGQEILVIFNSSDIPQNVIMGGGGSGFEPILVAESSTAVRRAKNLVATFKRIVIDGDYRWLKIFESAIPSEPEEPAPPIISAPVFSPKGGSYLNPQTVEIINTEDGADLFYTDGNGDPDTPYTGALNIADDTTLVAVAKKDGISSADVSETYEILGYVVNAVIFNPTGGTYENSVTVGLSTSTVGANIYFTTDGSVPDSSSSLYTGVITVSSTTTIKAIAILTVASIEYSSQVREQTYTIELNPVEPVLEPPIFSPAEGTYTESVQVEITCADSEAIIRYTTDGSEPTSASPIYQLPFLLSGQGEFTVKAITQRAGYQDGQGQAVYTLVPDGGGLAPVKPVLIPSSSTFADTEEVIIVGGSAEGTQEFLYTTDGSDPTNTSQLYTAPLVLTETTLIKAVARFQGQSELSEIREGLYTKSNQEGYPVGWNLISIPYKASLTAEALVEIFNGLVSPTAIYAFDSGFISVGDNLNLAEKSTRVDIGRGYWVYLNGATAVDWTDPTLLEKKFNLLSNRDVVINDVGFPRSWGEADTGLNQPLSTWSRGNYSGTQYNRVNLRGVTTGSATYKFYIDDPVVKCYGVQSFELSMGLYLPQPVAGNVKIGVEVYNKDETSLYVNENTLSITVGGYDVEEQFTIDSGANDYVLVRPFVSITHNFPNVTDYFRFAIRNRKFTTPLELSTEPVKVDIQNQNQDVWLTVGSLGKQFSQLRDENGATDRIVSGSFYKFNGTYEVAEFNNMQTGRGYYVQFTQGSTKYEVR